MRSPSYDLPEIERMRGKPGRLVDFVRGCSFFTRPDKDTQQAGIGEHVALAYLRDAPGEAQALQDALERKGFTELRYLERGLYGVAFEVRDAEQGIAYVLNLRDATPWRRAELAEKHGVDEQFFESEVTPRVMHAIIRPIKTYQFNVKSGPRAAQYHVTKTYRIHTLEDAVDERVVTQGDALYLRECLAAELARGGYILWDPKLKNLAIGNDHTPYVLDTGAAEKADVITNLQVVQALQTITLNGGQRLVDMLYSEFDESVAPRHVLELVRSQVPLSRAQLEALPLDAGALAKRLAAHEPALGYGQRLASNLRWDGSWHANGVEKQLDPAYMCGKPAMIQGRTGR